MNLINVGRMVLSCQQNPIMIEVSNTAKPHVTDITNRLLTGNRYGIQVGLFPFPFNF